MSQEEKLFFRINGGVSEIHSGSNFPPLDIVDNLEYIHTPLHKDQSFLHRKYVQEGLSIAQIADFTFSSKGAIRRGLQEAGIPIREPHQHHGKPSQPKYGKRLLKGRAVPVKHEQRVIDAVHSLRDQNLTLRAIAKVLNEMKVPTKCRGKSWHPEMVRRVLR